MVNEVIMRKVKCCVPELRFSEFRNAGAWMEKPFEKVFDRLTTKNKENNQNVLTISAQQGLISQLDYFNKKVSAKDVSGYYLLNKGDFAYNKSYSKGYPAGAIKLLKDYEKGVVSTLYICFKINSSNQGTFFEQYFNAGILNAEIGKIAQEGGRAHGLLNVSVKEFFKDINLFVPESKEQQKIANCLSSIDNLITAHSQKHEALKAHKKGLMQQLFPAEGETVPKLRFPEFRDAGEWEEGVIDDLANGVMGNAFKSSDFVEDGIQLMRMGNLYQGELQLNRTPVYLPKYFSEKYSSFLVKPLDLLMSMTGTMGKRDYGFIVQTSESCEQLLLNQRVLKIVHKANCIKGFLLQLLKSESLLNELYSLPGGTKQANLSAQQFKGLKVTFPKPLEQQKIADCLSSIDELITAQAQKIDSLKAHKKGLMQQLFPAVDEVNA